MLSFANLFAALMAVCASFLMLPENGEGRTLSLVCIVPVLVIPVALALFSVPSVYICACVMAILWVYLGIRIFCRYKSTFHINGKHSKGLRVRLEARMFYSSQAFLLGFLFVLTAEAIPGWVMAAAAVPLVAVLAFRAVSGANLFIRVRNPRKPSSLLHDDAALRVDSLKRVFDRAEAYMMEHKPYANGRLPESLLARLIGASRTDLSRAISWYAEKNYSQYVNDYRVGYAADLMTKDPYLKVTEVGRMSGFHSEGAFTTVFRERIGQTPSEYMRHERYRRA